MIIADIIKELEAVSPADLRKAIDGVRDVFRVLPVKLKEQMLGDYSNTEYSLISALRNVTDGHIGIDNVDILAIYQSRNN